MEIIKDFRNELFKRQELIAELESEKNPGFDEVRKMIAEKVGKPEENIDVLGVKGKFGKKIFEVKSYVYDSKEDLENMKKLRMTAKERKEGKKEKGKEEAGEKTDTAPVEELPEQIEEKPKEKPTEAPVEEKPEEEKKAVEEEKQKEEEAKEP